jgi:ubiquinone/menaquinone biosynthesis C-methylase UbiE
MPTKPLFTVNSVTNICFKNNIFNTVLCIGVVAYVFEYEKLISEIKRILKTNGRFIVQINKIEYPWIYKRTIPAYHLLKEIITGKKYDRINFEYNFLNHNLFIESMAKKNLCIEKIHYYDFRIPFIDILFPRFSIYIGKKMFQNRHKKIFNIFANGLIIEVKKTVKKDK